MPGCVAMVSSLIVRCGAGLIVNDDPDQKFSSVFWCIILEPRHVISNNVAF